MVASVLLNLSAAFGGSLSTLLFGLGRRAPQTSSETFHWAVDGALTQKLRREQVSMESSVTNATPVLLLPPKEEVSGTTVGDGTERL